MPRLVRTIRSEADHGTRYGYIECKCRCPLCREYAHRSYLKYKRAPNELPKSIQMANDWVVAERFWEQRRLSEVSRRQPYPETFNERSWSDETQEGNRGPLFTALTRADVMRAREQMIP